MPWISQMIGFALLMLGIAVALWVSFWLLLLVLILGIGMVLWVHVRDFLLRKGILNPRFAGPHQMRHANEDEPGDATAAPLPPIIEGDYKRVDSE